MELFYELDPDVILCDPNYLHGTGFDSSWDESDTQEIIDNVAPFFGNNISRRREFHTYKLYSLYEAFDCLADLFQERERYEAFRSVHDEMQERIQAKLPPKTERPEVGLVNFGSKPSEGSFAAMTTEGEGVEMKQYRDLGIQSTFTDAHADGDLDYETMLEIDPEILIVHGGVRLTDDDGEYSASAFHEQFIAPMEADSVGSQLTAVREGNVYPGGYFLQGPIANLFQTELTARLLYPDEFGAFDPENFPDVPQDEQLFDRERIANVINGDS
jgi:iron complex transport system substrate-binding protein